jgi:hypothetical protein
MQFLSKLRACVECVNVDVIAWAICMCLENLRQMNY